MSLPSGTAPPRRKHQSNIDRSVGEKPRATLTLRPTGRWLAEQIPCLSQEETADAVSRSLWRDATGPGSSDWFSRRAVTSSPSIPQILPRTQQQAPNRP